jgi:hypothetical protein
MHEWQGRAGGGGGAPVQQGAAAVKSKWRLKCVRVSYHYSEQRELKPDELLKIVAGMDVAGC